METLVAGLSDGAIYGLIAVGIVLVYRGSRVLNFAQGEMGTFALYIAWVLIEKRGMPWWLGAFLAIAALAAIGVLFERVVVRTMGDASRVSVTVATLGLMLLLFGIEFKLFGNGSQILSPPFAGVGPQIFGFFMSPTRILAIVAVIAIGAGLAVFLRRTDFGLGVLAASQDPTATRLVGVPLARVSAFTWGVAGAIGALAALLIIPSIGAFQPGKMTQLFVLSLAAALVGGLTSLPGAFVGGAAVGVLKAFVEQAFVESTFPGAQYVAVLVAIVAVLMFRPQGLLGKVTA